MNFMVDLSIYERIYNFIEILMEKNERSKRKYESYLSLKFFDCWIGDIK